MENDLVLNEIYEILAGLVEHSPQEINISFYPKHNSIEMYVGIGFTRNPCAEVPMPICIVYLKENYIRSRHGSVKFDNIIDLNDPSINWNKTLQEWLRTKLNIWT